MNSRSVYQLLVLCLVGLLILMSPPHQPFFDYQTLSTTRRLIRQVRVVLRIARGSIPSYSIPFSDLTHQTDILSGEASQPTFQTVEQVLVLPNIT